MKFCEEYNVKCKEIFIDKGYSGMKLSRPGIRKIIDSNNKTIIIVSSICKITRSYINLIEILKNKDTQIISVTEQVMIRLA